MKLAPINIENTSMLIHPFRQMDLIRNSEITEDVFNIFSDDDVVKFVPEKKMVDMSLAQNFMMQAITYSYTGALVTEFITYKKTNRVIGVIEIISPRMVQENYPDIKPNIWLIEYYLNKRFWGYKIMTHAISAIISSMFEQNIQDIGAIVRRENAPSIKLLESNDFVWKMKYDIYQDYYEYAPF